MLLVAEDLVILNINRMAVSSAAKLSHHSLYP